MNRKKRMSRKKLTLASLVAIPVVAGLAFAVTGSAFAGTNGQQIEVCQDEVGDYRVVDVTGTNENGQPASTTADVTPYGCSTLEGFWWKGTVRLSWRDPINPINIPRIFTTTCEVPEVQERDIFMCYGPFGG